MQFISHSIFAVFLTFIRIMNWNIFKNIAETIHFIFLSLAIIGAAWWFAYRGESYARANLDHELVFVNIENQKVWGLLTLKIENTGNKIIRLKDVFIKIEQILPMSDEIKFQVENGWDLINKDETRVNWSNIIETEIPSSDFIRPGEEAEIYYEFELPIITKKIRLYTFVNNKKGDNNGWYKISILDIHKKYKTNHN